ncbi:outer membrane beta-barrel protein [Helicobacter trogontum]|uniref:Outer membrane beta-barrel protein n=1 Tax=Helicobacter trogontum TaxID=50960 RepID=A0A4U8SCK9_9HELI|nr:outer membrane beta-barrel protein [Helicobacter trogontum]TLD83815.1 outer membrane beta-barrel protein [Helicobacter trogontum]
MRKTLSVIAASVVCAIGFSNTAMAEEKSGLFVGVHGGVSLFSISMQGANGDRFPDSAVNAIFGDTMATTFNVGANVGYQHFFIPLVGVRGYLGYDFNGSRKISNTFANGNLSFQNITLNVDAMLNFLNLDSFSLGAYVGFGLGYGIMGVSGDQALVDFFNNGYNYNGFNIPINVGISATFAESHRVEIGAKIQALSAQATPKGISSNDKSGIFLNTHVIHLGYSYIF